ncbi:MAG: formate dehydrogenase subunit alpha [Alphaproteobacteria bacterium]|nr:formate dehydrogenase subunit alpha [Alphaproteobacteria bacterium]
MNKPVNTPVSFDLNGREVDAAPGETIWQVADRLGETLPHLCHTIEPGYRSDGNCRACVVEIDGERTLAPSCRRLPEAGMTVNTATDRAVQARAMVMELLLADQPPRTATHSPEAQFWQWAEAMEVTTSRFPARAAAPRPDPSHPAMQVNMDACIQCNLCVRACREVQVNDVIAMAGRGADSHIAFDFDDPMGDSRCVGCGECVRVCPTGALLPAAGPVEVDRKVASVCPYCGVGCQLEFHVRGEKIIAVEGRDGPANQGRLCVKGRFGFDYVHSPERLTKPLIRRAGIAKDDVAIDPANPLSHFREASWEEALSVAAQGLKSIRDEHGGRALAGFGSAKGSNEEAYLFQKLVRTGFGGNNVDHCTRLCHASSVAALMQTIGSGAVTAPFTDAVEADVVLIIGCNPPINHPVAATYFKQAARAGTKLIVIDPNGSVMEQYATWMLQLKPASDVALLNAILHVIISEGLVDHDYIAAHTDNFTALAEHIKAFPPEAMEDVTGVAAADIRAAARAFAGADKAMVFWGMGISQHVHGTDNARCLISLCLATGNVGRAGTGLHPLRGQNNVQGASDAGLIPMVYPDYQPVTDPAAKARFEALWQTELDSEPGLTVVEITDAIHDGAIKGLYIMGENPAMSDPNLSHARGALAKLRHLVVQDIFLTETACYADVVLPATAWPEKDGTVTNSNRQVQMGRMAVAPPGEARPDLWIIGEIAAGLGLEWQYDGPEPVFEEMRLAMDSIQGMSWRRLAAEDAITYPCNGPDDPGQAVMFGDGFPTENGRGLFVPCDITDPDELPDRDYPLVLLTGRLLEHWHTGAITRRAPVLDLLEPEAVAYLAPSALENLQLSAGDTIQVESRRGTISLTARSDAGVQPGTVFIPFCFAEAAVNLLTNAALDPDGKIAEVKFCAVRVTPA